MPTLVILFDGAGGTVREEYKVRNGWRVPGPRADGTLTFEDEEGRDVRINWNRVLSSWVEG